jgi:hypothetical protein
VPFVGLSLLGEPCNSAIHLPSKEKGIGRFMLGYDEQVSGPRINSQYFRFLDAKIVV